MTGPVERFAGQIASHGYVVGASGSSRDQMVSHAEDSSVSVDLSRVRGPRTYLLRYGRCLVSIISIGHSSNVRPLVGTDRGNKYKVESYRVFDCLLDNVFRSRKQWLPTMRYLFPSPLF